MGYSRTHVHTFNASNTVMACYVSAVARNTSSEEKLLGAKHLERNSKISLWKATSPNMPNAFEKITTLREVDAFFKGVASERQVGLRQMRAINQQMSLLQPGDNLRIAALHCQIKVLAQKDKSCQLLLALRDGINDKVCSLDLEKIPKERPRAPLLPRRLIPQKDTAVQTTETLTADASTQTQFTSEAQIVPVKQYACAQTQTLAQSPKETTQPTIQVNTSTVVNVIQRENPIPSSQKNLVPAKKMGAFKWFKTTVKGHIQEFKEQLGERLLQDKSRNKGI